MKDASGFKRTFIVNDRSVEVFGAKQESGSWLVSARFVPKPMNDDEMSAWRFFAPRPVAVQETIAELRLEVTSPTLERALEAGEALAHRVGHLAVNSDSRGGQGSERRRGWS